MKTTTTIDKAEARTLSPSSRITHHASRFTFHVSRLTPPMPRTSPAFTLIELLAVIAVIALLAALTFPAVRAAKISVMRSRAKAELMQLESAIERFNQKLGYYPPDNPGPAASNPNHWALPPLYYELLGTTNSSGVFHTLDDSAQTISAASLAPGPGPFGPNVTGFVNCTRPGRSGDESSATAFVNNLKPSQFLAITNGGSATPICSVLGTTLDGPLLYQNGNGIKLNPWRYNSSDPHYNPKTFDLWIDVMAGDKTNRICNWSDKPLVVYSPYPP
jgi:prepilin-type N-terminal cleavage/methylation domain-containing protein